MKDLKTPESTYIIRFPDCDPFNHLNNSRYLDYFINAREDHLVENYQFNIYEYASKTGRSWVVGQNQIAYFSAALLMEKVVIQTTILELNVNDIAVEMRMWNESKTRLKSLLWSKFVHFDLKTQKRTDHSDDLTAIFSPFENPLSRKMTFEERAMEVKNKEYLNF